MSAALVSRLMACNAPADLIADVIKLANDADLLRQQREGARNRKRKSRDVTGPDVTGRDVTAPTEPLSSSLLPREEKKEVRSLRSLTVRAQADEDFEAMWSVYPRRPGNPKEPARKAYHKQRAEGATAEEIHRGALLLAKAMAGEEPRFVPHAATWLNQKRYLDDHAPVPTTRKPNALLEACDTVIQAAEDAERRSRYSDGEAGQVLDWPVQRLPGFR
jgi:hypothetical protein